MIESITIKNVATYSAIPQKLDGLSKINFLFGSNGSGKTTISNIIDNESNFSECKIAWKGTQLETMVYNRDFIDRNFSPSKEIKGVFTLGEQQHDTLEKISLAKKAVKDLETEYENLKSKLQGKDGISGKIEIEEEFKEECWSKKVEYDKKFIKGFQGFRDKKERFKDEILIQKNTNKVELLTFTELENKAKIVFGKNTDEKKSINPIDPASILSHEANEILKKKVIGKEDVNIAEMIETLGNSDWVQKGREFYDVNGEVCPFCQQKTNKEFSDSLNKYFGKAFESDAKAIEDIKANYIKDADKIQEIISSLVHNPSEFLKIEELKSKQELLKTKIDFNNQKIARKQREPSQIVELDSLAAVLEAINDMIDTTNKNIRDHNDTVRNVESEKKSLTLQMWRFVVANLKDEIEKFEKDKNKLINDIASMKESINNINERKDAKLKYIQELEKKITSVQPTIDKMNHLLNLFGFKGFNFAKVSETSYKIVRSDGSDVKNTLSEGEKNFVTFLYFYHLIKGSDSDSGMTTDRIVVFDDPVSSIDSDILFIVSTLIRGLFKKVEEEKGYIKQVFVFTHNVYFHKEVSYNPENTCNRNMKFWIARKPEQYSKIEPYNNKNPVKNSYQLLWREVRKAQSKKYDDIYSNVVIQNTLRRILEYYFKILGSVDRNVIYEKFDKVGEKEICKSLFAWVNDGSHFVYEDMYVSNNDLTVDTYLKVFKEIFCKLGHEAHYTMMMRVPIIKPVDE